MSDEIAFAGVPVDEAVRIVRAHVRAEVRPATRWERVRLFVRRWLGR